jgi:hypothetical protein
MTAGGQGAEEPGYGDGINCRILSPVVVDRDCPQCSSILSSTPASHKSRSPRWLQRRLQNGTRIVPDGTRVPVRELEASLQRFSDFI